MEEHQLDPFDALELVKAQDGRFLGGGDVRIGEFILLVDSDTRIPVDCILPTVSELLQSPRVGFTQHLITPMQVTPPTSSSVFSFQNGRLRGNRSFGTDCMVALPAPVVRLPDSHVYALWP